MIPTFTGCWAEGQSPICTGRRCRGSPHPLLLGECKQEADECLSLCEMILSFLWSCDFTPFPLSLKGVITDINCVTPLHTLSAACPVQWAIKKKSLYIYYYFNVNVQEHEAWIKSCLWCLQSYVNFCNVNFILTFSMFSNVEKVIFHPYIYWPQ